jgi:AmmeMemoRadiSam system protein A
MTVAAGFRDPAALGDALIAHARHALATRLGLPADAAPTQAHEALTEPGATFVTLRWRGELRGCIGTLSARQSLLEDVREHAVAAGFRDPRFPPLSAGEFAEIQVEVSVLTPSEPVQAASEAQARTQLEPGVDGVVLEWRHARATFLPQVWEQLPEPADFLGALRRKAGLPEDFWAADLKLSRYRVHKFVEATPA